MTINFGDGTTLDSATISAGKLLQVQQTVKSDKSSTTSTSFIDVPSLNVSITPAATSNKILIRAVVSCGAGGGGIDNKIRLMRGTTQLLNDQFVRQQGSEENYTWVMEKLDSPNTTSATTYKIQFRADSNEVLINTDGSNELLGTSTITAMEID
tara:strand:- start:1939 stop:2400 length:462 start_codon:yes stop_codon:yes gene_type:complete